MKDGVLLGTMASLVARVKCNFSEKHTNCIYPLRRLGAWTILNEYQKSQ